MATECNNYLPVAMWEEIDLRVSDSLPSDLRVGGMPPWDTLLPNFLACRGVSPTSTSQVVLTPGTMVPSSSKRDLNGVKSLMFMILYLAL
jgi:hypothetical protein